MSVEKDPKHEDNYVPREQLSEAELEDALQTCANEPIHIPGSIQPHGGLFVLDKDKLTILQVSENIESFTNVTPEKCVGQHLKDIIGKTETDLIESAARIGDLQPVRSVAIRILDVEYDAVSYHSGDFLVLEIEPVTYSENQESADDYYYNQLRNFSVELLATTNIDSLYELLVNHVRKVTSFDRVKLYKFDESWNGAIIAESKKDFMPSYLGLHFPSTDIPEQARKLYSQNYLRLIADIEYKPVPFYPRQIKGHDKPLDLSLSVIRSVSPVHIQYLDNINVKASMSISIIQNDKLWGLVACHHNSAYRIPYRIRVLSEIMGHMFSARLASLEGIRVKEQTAKKNLLIEKLSRQTNLSSPNDIFSGNHDIALQALNADGLIIRTGNKIQSFGEIPEKGDLDSFLNYCHDNLANWMIYTNNAENFLKGTDFNFPLSGGFLAVAIGTMDKDIAVWFRKERISQVNWGGNPEKPLTKTKAGYRLTPRSSFALWQATMHGKSEAWAEEDISAARTIADILLESEKIYAQRANLAKSDFLANMSHELRTPMNAVVGIINILNKDKQLSGRQRELISTLNVSAASLLELINDLLDISKIEAGEVELEHEPMTIPQIMEDLRSLLKVRAYEKGLELNISYDRKNTTTYLGDHMRIRQILVNIVNNAIKFTPQGFVNILLSADAHNHDDAVFTFDIIDSGIGISEEKCKHIFEKFVQEDASTTRQFGGTGLGLAITKNLVELMNGVISVASKKGVGTRFTVKIPVKCILEANDHCGDTHAPVIVPDEPFDAQQKKKKILLVEDYEGNIVVALYFLQEKGYEVVIANNGEEAVMKMEREDFDCILMDIQMPVMDGYTATKIIRQKQQANEFKDTPILGMTANAFKGDRQKCLDAGMDDYISKPLDFNTLEMKIKALINKNEDH